MPTPTFTDVGHWLVIFIVLAKFWIDWKREERAKRAEVEPRHEPTIDAKIEARAKTVEEHFGREINQIHGRISKLRDELRGDLKETSSKVESAADRMTATFATTVEKIGRIDGKVTHMDQQLHGLNSQLQRHIETDKP